MRRHASQHEGVFSLLTHSKFYKFMAGFKNEDKGI